MYRTLIGVQYIQAVAAQYRSDESAHLRIETLHATSLCIAGAAKKC